MSKSKQIEGSDTQHYVSQRKKRGTVKKSMQPPLTPMIDVTFQLLLYFILTSQFRAEEGGIPGSLPRDDGQAAVSEDPREPIQITIRPSSAIGGRVVYHIASLPPIESEKELTEQLIKRRGTGEEPPPVLLEPYGTVTWEYVTQAFNAAVKAKFTEIEWVSSNS